ncbi:hypothetical protein EVAR_56649_1 [Eumeta japonica]|uniref:Uncharacterized protein n=1 Tax=Eumeta variegata TaxID=151549 RepID=A0A4C1YW46_EUMVA|nr:hypothetical protein EVAR_56649_1 [Eumeta japonica]
MNHSSIELRRIFVERRGRRARGVAVASCPRRACRPRSAESTHCNDQWRRARRAVCCDCVNRVYTDERPHRC